MPHRDPDDPPRRRANEARGHGTWDNDRPPVCGVVGRESGQVRLTVAAHSDRVTLEAVVGDATRPGTTVNTDEWSGYNGLVAMDRGHATVCHADREWARDDDGDGVREVHDNTLEGLWTGLRDFLRPFRGVNKKSLQQYVALFEWGHNVKRATASFLGALLGVRAATEMESPPSAPHEPHFLNMRPSLREMPMNTRSGKTRGPLKGQSWRRTIADQAQSDLPISEYCRQLGLDPRSFRSWRQELEIRRLLNPHPKGDANTAA